MEIKPSDALIAEIYQSLGRAEEILSPDQLASVYVEALTGEFARFVHGKIAIKLLES